MARVLEQHLIPADGVRGPEDGIFSGQTKDGHEVHIVADAHSSFVTDPICNMTPGQFALTTFLYSIPQTILGSDPYSWVAQLSLAVGTALKNAGRFEESKRNPEYRRPGLVMVAYIPHLSVIVRVGDCMYLADGVGYNPGLAVDHVKTKMRVGELRRKLARGMQLKTILRGDPTQEDMRRETLRWQHAFRNSIAAHGYGVVDGTPIPQGRIGVISVANASHIVLTSDGIAPAHLKGTWEETFTLMQNALALDPLCIGEELAGVRPAALVKEGEVHDLEVYSPVADAAVRPPDDITYLSLEV